ncbi:MAG TPA: hypothetical protein VN371_00770 [Chlorobaculum sp.]|nr:hypothetical protein [Chlorobaculum sp.]
MGRGLFSRGVVVATMIVMTGALGACRQKAAPDRTVKPVDQHQGKSTDDGQSQNVTIETKGRTVEILGAVDGWPKEIPVEVPEFSFGTIRRVIRTESPEGQSWDLIMENVREHAIRDYEATLKSRGFQTSSMIVVGKEGERGSVTGEKGSLTIVLISTNGNSSLSVIVKR